MRQAAQQGMRGDELALRLDEIGRQEAAEKMSLSYAGRLGRAIEPALKPLGFDWKIGIGLIGSLAAREVFVATMAVVYGIGSADDQQSSLVSSIRSEFSALVGISVIIFFILACQCLATVAVVKRESHSWGWAAFQLVYMTALAYAASLLFYQAASRIWPGLA
jgi:ferrous iron transport protein B